MNMTSSTILADLSNTMNRFPIKSEARKNCVKVSKILKFAESTTNLEWMESDLIWLDGYYSGPDELVGVFSHHIIEHAMNMLKGSIARLKNS